MRSNPRRLMDKRIEDLGEVSFSRRHTGKRVTSKRLGKLTGVRLSNSKSRRRT